MTPEKRSVSSSLRSFKSSLLRIWSQAKKEVRLYFGNKGSIVVDLILPPMVILMYSFIFIQTSSADTSVSAVIISYDSNEYIEQFNESYSIKTYYDNYTDLYLDAINKSKLEIYRFYNATEDVYAMNTARSLLLNGSVDCIIKIPDKFSEMIIWGQPAVIECLLDYSRADAFDVANAVTESIKIFVDDNNLTLIGLEQRAEFSIPEGYDANYNWAMTTMICLAIFVMTRGLCVLNVVGDKQIGRLLLTPSKRWELLTAKYVAYSLILGAWVFLYLGTIIVSGLHIVGSLFDLYIALYIVGFVGLALGMCVSTVCKTKAQANQLILAIFFVIFVLSGVFIPIEAMPPEMQFFANILPLSHGEPLIKSVITKGNSPLGFHFYWLLISGAFLSTLSYITFSKRKYEV